MKTPTVEKNSAVEKAIAIAGSQKADVYFPP